MTSADLDDQEKRCEECGAPKDGVRGAMPYGWGPGPIRWLCAKCAPGAYARFTAERQEKDDLNVEAMAEALYLHSYPYLHQGAPPRIVWQGVRPVVRDYYLLYARSLIEMYRCTLIPVAERTVRLRDVDPELHAMIHGRHST